MTRPRGSKREADEVSRHKKATEERKAAREEAMDWGKNLMVNRRVDKDPDT